MRNSLITMMLLSAFTAIWSPSAASLRAAGGNEIAPPCISGDNYISEKAAPEDCREVLIGYFGPHDANDPEFGAMWCAASLAVEQANKAGGYKGTPFRLVPGWSENPWGSGVRDVAEMAYRDRVWAVIGGIDGPSTHLAEQVVAKARLTLLSGANADRTANLANVSWMFCALPGHHLQAAAMAGAMDSLLDEKRFVVVSTVDHDSHLLWAELEKCLRSRRIAPSYHFESRRGQADSPELVDGVLASRSEAVVVIAGLQDSARLCAGLRGRGFRGTIFGGPCMSGRRFADLAGDAAEGTVFPVLCESSDRARAFEEQLLERFVKEGDYLSAHTYDTVSILVEAIRRAGLDRQRIRDEIRRLSPYSGVTGRVCWDKQGSNCRRVSMGVRRGGLVRAMAWR